MILLVLVGIESVLLSFSPTPMQLAAVSARDKVDEKKCGFPGDVHEIQIEKTSAGVKTKIERVSSIPYPPPTGSDEWNEGTCEVFWFDEKGERQSTFVRIGERLQTQDVQNAKAALIDATLENDVSNLLNLPESAWEKSALFNDISIPKPYALQLQEKLGEKYEYLRAAQEATMAERLSQLGEGTSPYGDYSSPFDSTALGKEMFVLAKLDARIAKVTRSPPPQTPVPQVYVPTSEYAQQLTTFSESVKNIRSQTARVADTVRTFFYDYTVGGKFGTAVRQPLLDWYRDLFR